jgi:hypothetical protein
MKAYIKNRREMTRQMFHAVKGGALQRLLPKNLRVHIFALNFQLYLHLQHIPLEDLQELCIEEIQVMSKKRLLCYLNGREMTSSSSSNESADTDDDDTGAVKRKCCAV